MPVNIVEVKEYECIKCGYKWINHKDGHDGALPRRCAKCKQLDWDKGPISRKESKVRYQLRFTLGEWKSHPMRPHYWRTDSNVDRLLQFRPSIEDMKLILEPMCYLFKDSKMLYKHYEYYKPHILEKLDWSEHELERRKRRWENNAVRHLTKGTSKEVSEARDYQLQLSRQLVEYFLEKYSSPYQE
jgi:hypothetical protein